MLIEWFLPHAGLDTAWLGIPVLMLIGAAIGAFNGVLVTILRYQPVIATLCTFFVLTGVIEKIAPTPKSPHAGNWTTDFADKLVGPIPGALVLMAIPLVIWFALSRTAFHRNLYAVGGNDTTAFSAGVNVHATRIMAYALGGAFAMVAGVALTALVQSTQSAGFASYTLVALAAVALGGTQLGGGRGGLIPSLLGAVCIYQMQTLLGGRRRLELLAGVRLWRDARRGRRRRRQAADPPAARSRRMSRVLDLQRRAPVLQLAALVVLFAYGASTIAGFSSETSVDSMLVLAALLGLAALGQTFVLVLGGLDLSVPGHIVMGAIVVSQLYGSHGWSAPLAIAFVVVVAAAAGAATGWICHRWQIQPLIVTLGVGAMSAGAAIAWTQGRLTGTAPAFLTDLTTATGTTAGLSIPPIVVIWAVVAIIAGVVAHRTVAGRKLYATGANPRAAGLARVNTRRVVVSVFALSAVASALVGVLLAGFAGADQTIGDPYLFSGLTAVIVGGTTFMGARGDYSHTVVGALILTVLTTILVGKGYSQADQQIIFGVLILLVVAGYGRDRRLRDRV